MPRFLHISLSLSCSKALMICSRSHGYITAISFFQPYIFTSPHTGCTFSASQLCPLSLFILLSSLPFFIFPFRLPWVLTCVLSLCFLSFLLSFSQPAPLLLTVQCAVCLLCSERAQHYTVKLGHNPLNGTHTSVLQQGQQEMCAYVCACAGSVLWCINVLTCSHEINKGS